jgi:pimeloyl-ACP methyl ester carboxylesterase
LPWPTNKQRSAADATTGNSGNEKRRHVPVTLRHRRPNRRAGATRRPKAASGRTGPQARTAVSIALATGHSDGIVAFAQTDSTEDLKQIRVPVRVMHGDDDQIVPYADSGPLSAELVQNATLKTFEGFPHGMPTTQAETINADLLAFLQS